MLGSTQSQPQWLSCQTDAVGAFPDLANILYISRYFDGGIKSELKQMVENIRESFANIVEANDWMDSETKSKALIKLLHSKYFL